MQKDPQTGRVHVGVRRRDNKNYISYCKYGCPWAQMNPFLNERT